MSAVQVTGGLGEKSVRVAGWDLGEMSAVQVTGGLGEKSVRVAGWDLGEMCR